MGLFGGSTTTTTKSEPWKPQGQALENAFSSATNLYNSKSGTPWYQGQLHAGLDPLTQQGIQATGLYAQGAGQTAADQVGSVGSNILGAAGQGMIGALGSYQNLANTDATSANIAAAGQYANNPYLESQIDAIGGDIRRNLGENIMPSIDREATATGNINSSRAGVAEGIAARGANEALADASANMRYQAYNNGLGLAESARTSNLGASANAAGLYTDAVKTGMSGAQTGQGMNLQNLQSMIAAGQISQEDAQGLLDSELMRWQGNDTRDADLLNQYYNIIGSNNWGGTQTQKVKQSGSILGNILGVASVAGGLGLFGGGGAKAG